MRLLLSFALTLAFALPATAGPKNVVLLVADDLGLQVGCYGDTVTKTPNLDALAKSGTRFTHAFASVASCSPSRATLLTGMPTHQCGQYGLAHATHNQHSFRTVRGLPALLKPAGYTSGVIAKLHVQPKEVYPFDVEVAGNGRNPVQIAQQAKKFVADCGDKPFFLLVGFTDPHRAAKGFANDLKFPAEVPVVKFDAEERARAVPPAGHRGGARRTRGVLPVDRAPGSRRRNGVEGAGRVEATRQHARHLPERQRHPVPRREDDAVRQRHSPPADRAQAGAESRGCVFGDGELDGHHADDPRLVRGEAGTGGQEGIAAPGSFAVAAVGEGERGRLGHGVRVAPVPRGDDVLPDARWCGRGRTSIS